MTPMVNDRHPGGCDGVVFIEADNDDFADIFPLDNSGSVTSQPSDYDSENYHWQWTPAESHQMTSAAATAPYCYKNTVPGPPASADFQPPAAASSCSAYLSMMSLSQDPGHLYQCGTSQGCWIQPSGPRLRGQGVESEEQGILMLTNSEAGLVVKVTLLAAGFVIGPAGSSVRAISHCSGATIKSWTESSSRNSDTTDAHHHRSGDDRPRPQRVFIISGSHACKKEALRIIDATVERYKHLCEGECLGKFVSRMQRIEDINFVYQPPPRHLVPFAASLLSTRKSPPNPRQGLLNTSSSSSSSDSAMCSTESGGVMSRYSSSDSGSQGKVDQWLATSASWHQQGSDLHHQSMSASNYSSTGVSGRVTMPMIGHQQEPPQPTVLNMLQTVKSVNICQPNLSSSTWSPGRGVSISSRAKLAPPPPPPPRTAAQSQRNFSIKPDTAATDLRHHHPPPQQQQPMHRAHRHPPGLSSPEASLPRAASVIPGYSTQKHQKLQTDVSSVHQHQTMIFSQQQRCPSSTRHQAQQVLPSPPPAPWTPSPPPPPPASADISGQQRFDQIRQKQGQPMYWQLHRDPSHHQQAAADQAARQSSSRIVPQGSHQDC